MPLTDYFRILIRRWWILILLPVLTAASAYVFSKLQTPEYKASAYVLVQPSRTDLGLTQSAKTLLRSYVAWLYTRDNAQKVITALQQEMAPEALLGNTTVASDDSRFVIQIDVLSNNEQIAGDAARKWAELLEQWRTGENAKVQRQDQVNATVIDLPPPALYRPQTKINVLAGGVLGVLLGGLVIFLLEYIESGVIRSAQDVERSLALSVLGVIPSADPAQSKAKGSRHAQ